ncbi:Rod cGMP-specific 3',5'-cyclic phosphodiesterase subunit alpha, partial [Clarias magur]
WTRVTAGSRSCVAPVKSSCSETQVSGRRASLTCTAPDTPPGKPTPQSGWTSGRDCCTCAARRS